jgi:hypothetical protein
MDERGYNVRGHDFREIVMEIAYNPLDETRKPERRLQDAEDLARDLAFGATQGDWEAEMVFNSDGSWRADFWGWGDDQRTENQRKFVVKWCDEGVRKPDYKLLISLGYLTFLRDYVSERQAFPGNPQANITVKTESVYYILSQKAFDLLKRPAETPDIFISYRRSDASPLALLIEARLRMAGADEQKIFVDRSIPGGAEWFAMIQDRAKRGGYVICIVGPTTFEGDSFVKNEIRWANEASATIIPIYHNGWTRAQCEAQLKDDSDVWNILTSRHDEQIYGDSSALKYESLVNFVLSSVGYKTYG